ncbi:GNAT family N-acetyltransferase [Streptomyces sp. GS7]|uniref:GNAT family N-acetyltransferase n=1 Tax=Streptomyces sp. GS7 TaxID=2692234 RepID=UPI001318D987|nr:GNAT family N-acetyltransferase [Streptomyces sp. GS7]QHC24104.1 GNAT family N-acetyltransferase [Streptomyces sp. GS7]
MSLAITPAIPAGTLSASAQPSIPSHDRELLLRPWESDDATILQRAFQDPSIRRWHTHHVSSPGEARDWIASSHRSWQQEQAAQWAVTRVGGEVVGRVALRWMDLLHGLAECAYWVLPHARGTGVAPRALAGLAAWALDEAGFHRLELAHAVDNEASCRVATKSGFALEGTRRSAHLRLDGWHDMHLHARVLGDS